MKLRDTDDLRPALSFWLAIIGAAWTLAAWGFFYAIAVFVTIFPIVIFALSRRVVSRKAGDHDLIIDVTPNQKEDGNG